MKTEFTHHAGDQYIVTGTLYQSEKRFRQVHVNPFHALNINLWRGSVWHLDGQTRKRTLIKRVVN